MNDINTKLEEIIAELKQSELTESEKKFIKVFYLMPDIMSIISYKNGHYVEVNNVWLQSAGYERSEVIGRTPMELGIWVLEEEQQANFINLLVNGNLSNYETQYRMKSGEIRDYLLSTINIDLGGESHLLSILKDITDRKRMEEALRLSEDKFSKAFSSNPEAINISTLEEGRIVEVNDAWVEATGYKTNEVIGRSATELGFWEPGEREILLEQIREYGNIRNFETKHQMKSGQVRWYLQSSEIVDMYGEPHLLSVYKDITERKRMEEALRSSEELFSKAFNASPITMSISTLEEGRFLKINDSFCKVIGFSRKEILGRTSADLGFWFNLDDRSLIKNKIINNESISDMEINFCRKKTEKRLGLLSADGIEINGIPCLLIIVTDITDRKQMEIEMTRLDRLNLVGEVAASIGHEIRNPMTTVRGYLQLLENQTKYMDDSEVFNLMIEELDRANSIITEFLSLTKSNEVKLSLYNLNSIVVSILPLIQANATSQDKYIKMQIEDVPDLLLDDKEVRQIILNLVCNGLEAMSPGGTLSISTFMKNEQVVLAIQDQGKGIEPRVQENLGTPFFTTKDHGTGLGLAVCYRIAARHNAKIDIETSEYGTTFYVRFSTK